MTEKLPNHIGWLLWQASHVWTERFTDALRGGGFAGVTLGQVNLMGYLDRSVGVRQNEIAARSGLTKQAVGQFISELERVGFVERIPDPTDGRARLVQYTPRGLALVAAGDAIKQSFEQEFAAQLGAAAFERLKEGLENFVHCAAADGKPEAR